MSVVHARAMAHRRRPTRPTVASSRYDGWARLRGSTTIRRRRLEHLLDQAAQHPVTAVWALAGAGKTTLVAEWLRRTTTPTAWITVEPEHGLTPAAVATALRRAGVATSGTSVEEVTHAVRVHPTPVRLVLDDLHHLRDSALVGVLVSTARSGPLRLTLCGRTLPALGFGRMRLNQEVYELGPTELAFTVDEAARLLDAQRLPLAPDALADLVERTEGWAAGLLLAAHALQDARIGSMADFDGDLPEVVDYVRDEVLGTLPTTTYELLVRTSIDGDVCADLAETLTGRGDAARILDEVSRDHLMVETGNSEGHWYRLPRLVRQALLHQARIELGSNLPTLHLRAAEWWNGRGKPIDAIRHSIAASAWRRAARLVVTVAAPEIAGPRRATLRALLNQLPSTSDTTESAAALALARADSHDLAAADRFRAVAQAHLHTLAPARRAAVAATVQLAAAMTARARGDHDAVWGHSQALLAAATSATDPPAVEGIRVVAAVHAGVAALWRADFVAAERHLALGLDGARAAGLDLAQADAQAHRALLLALQGRLTEAAELAHAQLAAARLATAIAAWERADSRATLAHLDAAQLVCDRAPDPAIELAVLVVRARVLQVDGEVTAARDQLSRAARAADELPGPLPLLAEAWLVEAVAADKLGLPGAVGIALRQALDVAAPEHLARPFHNGSSLAAALLWRHRDLLRAHAPFATTLPKDPQETAEPLPIESMTARESVVLRYLPTLLTAREIAAELFVSPNTVKTQLKSIYRKLAVPNRRAAVDRARRLGLLSS